jgi:putative DNA primase/helicase
VAEKRIVAVYDYRSESGELLYQVVRYEPKEFRQRRPDGKGGWIGNLEGVKRVLYRLPELMASSITDWVYIVEGEKDVDNLIARNFVATTNSGGARKWLDDYNRYFKGRLVAIIPDNDEPGRDHAKRIGEALHGIAGVVKIVELPNLPPKGDISDWFDSGRPEKVKELIRLTDEAPMFEPDLIDVSRPIVVSLADVKPLPIDWLWFNRIPLGMFTLILGDPGLGKSFLTLYMATKVSTGGTWPDSETPENSAPKGSVVILTAEDDLAHVVRPLLDALGADTTKIIALEGVKIKDENDREHCEYFNLQRDLPALQQAIRNQKDTKLVVIDPLSAYLGGRIDSHKDADVRSVLRPLVELSEQCAVAVIGVTHLNKNPTGKVVYQAMGSLAFLAAARTAWLVTADPNEPDSKRRLLTPAKHNVLIEPTGLAFEIIDGKVVFENEPLDITADQALSTVSTIEPEALNKAKTWLAEQLPQGSAVTAAEIFRQAEEEGIKKGTLRRAKQELGVVSYALSSEGKLHWFWRIDKL